MFISLLFRKCVHANGKRGKIISMEVKKRQQYISAKITIFILSPPHDKKHHKAYRFTWYSFWNIIYRAFVQHILSISNAFGFIIILQLRFSIVNVFNFTTLVRWLIILRPFLLISFKWKKKFYEFWMVSSICYLCKCLCEENF